MTDQAKAKGGPYTMRQINKIVIHHSATPASMDIGVEEIRRWHLDRGFNDIGYHYVIRRNGDVEEGRPLEKAGAHVRGHNADSIGVCLVGGRHETENRAFFNCTQGQMESLSGLLTEILMTRLPKENQGPVDVVGHRDLAATECPGFDVGQYFS